MGKSFRTINFFIIDNTPIEVVSASDLASFDYHTLNDFGHIRGTMQANDDDDKNFIFTMQDGKFIEFNVLPCDITDCTGTHKKGKLEAICKADSRIMLCTVKP
jgi:hypothetical protein